MRRLVVIGGLLAALAAPASALATPVATNDAQYAQLGRVFPDPLANCAASPCDPNAEGNQPATQFIQYPELIDGLRYLSSKPKWRRYVEVLPLDGKLGTGSGTAERKAFPGNDLGRFEFDPKAGYHSAGLPQTGQGRKRSDLIMVRVTDESVPDRGKKRYAISLSIHGIERAGAEGGTREIEDLVTAASTGTTGKRVLSGVKGRVPTRGEVLRKAIVYFTYPNPDGWRRGDVSEGGFFFQRYNGNGVDLNRDWPDVGFAFRPYSPLSEPESRSFARVFRQVAQRGGRFNQVADLHGQLEADALSYTLLPHGRHDYGKNTRIERTAETIHAASEKALAWSPIIQPNDAPRGGGVPCTPTVVGGDACARIYGQTWGTVYDTINYTTTGALSDWFDSPIGLSSDEIDNEMSFSHLDKNITFDPHTEQLHVAGNKALINAQLTRMLHPATARFKVAGSKGYVANARLKRRARRLRAKPPFGTHPQADVEGALGTPDPVAGGVVLPIDVKRSAKVFDGGMRVDVTNPNFQGVGTGLVTLTIQCKRCDRNRHPGEVGGDGWVTVTQDFNQSPLYAQAGVTAAVNEPQAFTRTGSRVLWRAVVGSGGIAPRFDVHFTSGSATSSGETGSPKAPAPRLRAYDVANTDFLRDLNRFIPRGDRRFRTVSPRGVALGRQSLRRFDSLTLADAPFPGSSSASLRTRWYAAVRKWVRGGGDLVLTDGALRALPSLTKIPASAVRRISVYVGQIAFAKDSNGDTLGDPLNRGVKIPGARFNIGMRRQTFEPVPVGYSIQDDAGNDETHSPQWQVARSAWEKAGGRTAATSVADGDVAGGNDYEQTAYGELKLGRGVIRVLGSGLPQPTEAFDRDFGLAPYSATYTTYILMRNMLKPAHTRPCHDLQRPRSFIDRDSVRKGRSGISLRGTAVDRGCGSGGRGKVGRVRISIATRTHNKGRCRFVKPGGGTTPARDCRQRSWMRAQGTEHWSFDYRHPLEPGTYTLRARALDAVGNLGLRTRKSTLHFAVR